MEKTILVNSFIGLQKIINIICKTAKQKEKEDVYKEMMKVLTSIPEKEIGKVKYVISYYGSKVGVLIFDGNKPEANKYKIMITKISGKGSFMMNLLSKLGYNIKLNDNIHYVFDGKRVIPIT